MYWLLPLYQAASIMFLCVFALTVATTSSDLFFPSHQHVDLQLLLSQACWLMPLLQTSRDVEQADFR
jgi:hypothetical protein